MLDGSAKLEPAAREALESQWTQACAAVMQLHAAGDAAAIPEALTLTLTLNLILTLTPPSPSPLPHPHPHLSPFTLAFTLTLTLTQALGAAKRLLDACGVDEAVAPRETSPIPPSLPIALALALTLTLTLTLTLIVT